MESAPGFDRVADVVVALTFGYGAGRHAAAQPRRALPGAPPA